MHVPGAQDSTHSYDNDPRTTEGYTPTSPSQTSSSALDLLSPSARPGPTVTRASSRDGTLAVEIARLRREIVRMRNDRQNSSGDTPAVGESASVLPPSYEEEIGEDYVENQGAGRAL